MYVHNLGACSMSTKEDELQMTVIPLIVSNSLRWLTLTRRRVKFRTP
ncbi:unnamed protein product [Brassica oleracea var. botrytis]